MTRWQFAWLTDQPYTTIGFSHPQSGLAQEMAAILGAGVYLPQSTEWSVSLDRSRVNLGYVSGLMGDRGWEMFTVETRLQPGAVMPSQLQTNWYFRRATHEPDSSTAISASATSEPAQPMPVAETPAAPAWTPEPAAPAISAAPAWTPEPAAPAISAAPAWTPDPAAPAASTWTPGPAAPGGSAAPAVETPAMPAYEAPGAAGYEAPATPSYVAPAAPEYVAPAAPSYDAPAAPGYVVPAAPSYNAPAPAAAPDPMASTWNAPTTPLAPYAPGQAPMMGGETSPTGAQEAAAQDSQASTGAPSEAGSADPGTPGNQY